MKWNDYQDTSSRGKSKVKNSGRKKKKKKTVVEYSREGDRKHTSCPDMGTDQFLELNQGTGDSR